MTELPTNLSSTYLDLGCLNHSFTVFFYKNISSLTSRSNFFKNIFQPLQPSQARLAFRVTLVGILTNLSQIFKLLCLLIQYQIRTTELLPLFFVLPDPPGSKHSPFPCIQFFFPFFLSYRAQLALQTPRLIQPNKFFKKKKKISLS